MVESGDAWSYSCRETVTLAAIVVVLHTTVVSAGSFSVRLVFWLESTAAPVPVLNAGTTTWAAFAGSGSSRHTSAVAFGTLADSVRTEAPKTGSDQGRHS